MRGYGFKNAKDRKHGPGREGAGVMASLRGGVVEFIGWVYSWCVLGRSVWKGLEELGFVTGLA